MWFNMAYVDVRGPDGRLLFKYDPDRMLVEIVSRGVSYVVDLTQYVPIEPVFVDIDPLAGLSHLT